jgi:hypothetical protein
MNTAGFPSSRSLPGCSLQAAFTRFRRHPVGSSSYSLGANFGSNPVDNNSVGDIEHGGIRTHGLCLRRAALYPAELRVRTKEDRPNR